MSIFNIVSLKWEERQVLAENEALKAEKEKLQQELANVDDPEYIEQEARRQLRLIRPGEILFVLPNEPETPSGPAILPGGEWDPQKEAETSQEGQASQE